MPTGIEEASIVLASVGVFLQLYDNCDRLYHGVKLNRRFGDDYMTAQIELEMQWCRLQEILQRPHILAKDCDLQDPNNAKRRQLVQYLGQMEKYFQACNELMTWYDGKEHRGPYVAGARTTDPLSTVTAGPGHTPKPAGQLTGPGGHSGIDSDIKPNDAAAQKQGRRGIRGFFSRSARPKSDKSKAKKEKNTPKGHVPEELLAEVKTAIETREYEAGQSQKMVNFWKRIEWIHRDQDDLRSTIEDLRRGNNNLESYLMLCSLGDPVRTLPSSDKVAAFWPVARRIEGTLKLLHKGLIKINTRTGTQESYFLSLQLREDHRDTWQELNAQDGVSLRDDSHVFNIQRHRQESLNDDAVLFSIEAYTAVKGIQQTLAEEPLSLTQALVDLHDREVTRDDEARNPVELWGYQVPEPNLSPSILAFYRDNEGCWSTPASLEDILGEGEYRDRILPVQTVQLARVITSAFLQLAGVRNSCEIPRPANYRYYRTSDEQDIWDSGSPRVLRPWLAFGFGRKPKAPKLGGGTGEARPPNALMVELGLVLYQIGTGDPIDYGSGRQGLTDAKNRAWKDLNRLDRRIGSVFAEVVAGFLNFSPTSAYLDQGNEQLDETAYIRSAISALVEYEQTVEGTATTPFRIPKVTFTVENPEDVESDTVSISANPSAVASSENVLEPGMGASSEAVTATASAASISEQITLSEDDLPLDPAAKPSGDVLRPADANTRGPPPASAKVGPSADSIKASEVAVVTSEAPADPQKA